MNKNLLTFLLLSFFSTLTAALYAQCGTVAKFGFPAFSCFGDTVQLTDSSIAGKPAYAWNFGDPFSGLKNTDTLANPKHKFTFSGTYNIRLVVSDTNGCKDTVEHTLKVVALPVASYTVSNRCVNLQTNFLSTSTKDPSDSIIEFSWHYGDGNSALGNSANHTYATFGVKNTKLVIKTLHGCADSVSQPITIYEEPVVQSDFDTLCRSNPFSFTVATGASVPTGYLWDFGDGASGNIAAPLHQYATKGKYYFNVRVGFPGGAFCFSKQDSLTVLPLPSAGFTVLNDTQCYSGNSVCLLLPKNTPGLRYRGITFGDGFKDETSPLNDTLVCYSYQDEDGGTYNITIEAVDSNFCTATFTRNNAVVIHPAFEVDFDLVNGSGCFVTDITLLNTTNQSPPDVVQFKWDLGDGTTDSVNWSTISHQYLTNGSFNLKLWAANHLGCEDSSIQNNAVTNTNFVVDASQDSAWSFCKNGNRIFFSQTFIPGASIFWDWGNGDSSVAWNTSVQYPLSGTYYPKVRISLNGCDSTTQLDTLIITGPTAEIGAIANRFQCEIKDTVVFRNASTYYFNQSRQFFWDVGDAFAPLCTTTTALNQNIGANCRYSTDSASFSHMYQPGQENCYWVTLTVTDTALGCTDSRSTWVALQPPNAKPPTPAVGMQLTRNNVCIGPEPDKAFTLELGGTFPSCGRESFWIMWDSTCAAQSGNFDSFWRFGELAHNYSYNNMPCDPDGWVTIGLIVQNGNDSTNNICRDTAWYHHFLRFLRMDPRFTSDYNPANYYCPGSSFTFTISDTNQDSITGMVWDWGDGSSDNNIDFNPRSHTYNSSGVFTVILSLTNSRGCVSIDSLSIKVGINNSFSVSKQQPCTTDSVHFSETIRYWNGTENFWSNPARKLAGKEELRWDFGQGNGFEDAGPNPVVKYNNIGNYTIKLAAKDSTGCWDTLVLTDFIRVYGIFPDFSFANDTFVCEQVIGFNNLTGLIDPFNAAIQPDDSILGYTWKFGTGISNSKLTNPFKFFQAGQYKVKLIADSKIGCRDSIEKDLLILGPKPHFQFITDSIGCQPLMVAFKNNSLEANTFIWKFGDAGNNTYTTTSDTNVSFTYEDAGVFFPTLTAQGRFFKNGVQITCEATFPDSATSLPGIRKVEVRDLPSPSFTYATNCVTRVTSFTNTSTISNGSMVKYEWDFGDNDTATGANPTHQYADTGRYKVTLRVFSDLGCVDSLVSDIIIAPNPAPKFVFNETCLGGITQFTDSTKSFNDAVYLWEWSFGDGTGSGLQNPSKTFAQDTTYSVKLKVTNIAGCSDSITQPITIHSYPVASFNHTDRCKGVSIFFGNTSTSKENPITNAWNFDDGTTSTANNVNKLYANSGSYAVKLRVTSPYGCADSITRTVTVFHKPEANYSVATAEQCFVGNNFSFLSSSSIDTGTISHAWRFGDGSTSSLVNPTHSYSTSSHFGVRLIVTSERGCRDTLIDSVRVNPNPVASFAINNPTQCLNANQFAFTDNSTITTGTYNRLWKTNLSHSNTNDTLIEVYTDTGVFSVKLTLTSNKGCIDSVVQNIRVLPVPKAMFSISDSLQCLSGNSFTFTGNSSIGWGAFQYSWDFGDGNTGSNPTEIHSYTNPGTYKVKLTNSSIAGSCIDTLTKTVTVHPMPIVNFTVLDDEQCRKGNRFRFTNLSTISSGTMTYFWNYGDNTFSTLKNPANKTYASHGLYDVKLVATSNFSCSDSTTQTMTVHPMVAMGWKTNGTSQCVNNQNFEFTDTSSLAYGTYSIRWNFGDSTFGFGNPVSKYYATPATYFVWLVTTTDQGCTDSLRKNIAVRPKPNPAFALNDTNQCLTGNQFLTTNLSTISSGTMAYTWLFGNGASSTLFQPTYSYPLAGNYTIALVARSNFNCRDTARVNVSVFQMPKPAIKINTPLQCLKNNSFLFDDTGTIANGTYTRVWQTGDGNIFTAKQFNHTYSDFGQYPVKLIAESNNGCKDSSTRTIRVFPQPKAEFTIGDSIQCFNGNLFAFTNNSHIDSGGFTNHWSLGDNSFSASSNTTHSYLSSDSFKVKLTVATGFGCKDSTEKFVRVDPMPKPKIYTNATEQCFRGNNFTFEDTGNIESGAYTVVWNLGDNNFSFLKQFNHTYNNHGSYTIKTIATSDKNCIDSVSAAIVVYPQPEAKFTVADSVQCLHANSFTFQNSSSLASGVLNFKWYFGDNDSSFAPSPTHSYDQHGTYTVLMVAYSDKGCNDTTFKIVRVNPMPDVVIQNNNLNQCFNNQNYEFSDNSSIPEGTLSRTWLLGENDTSFVKDVSKVFTSDGTFVVKLKQISDKQCVDSASVLVTVFPRPFAAFGIDDSAQCITGNLFSFTNSSIVSSGSLTYQWQTGDGNSFTDEDIVHSYSYPDTFTIRLAVATDKACFDTTEKLSIVYPKPQNTVIVNDTNQCINTNFYEFKGSSTVPYGTISHYFWDLGNGTLTQGSKDTTYKYLSFGTYNVRFATKSEFGCFDTTTIAVQLYPKPQAQFTINDTTQCLRGNLFSFSNNSTVALGTLSHKWHFGDNDSSNIQSPQKTYSFHDTFSVRYYATSAQNCTDTLFAVVTVYPHPKSLFGINDTAQCLNGNLFEFTNQTIIDYGNLSFKWHLDSNIFATATDTQYTYSKHGSYWVGLIADSEFGCKDTSNRNLIVHPKPNPDFTVGDWTDSSGKEKQCFNGHYFNFYNKSTIAYGNMNYKWTTKQDDSHIQHNYSFNMGYSYYDFGLKKIQLLATSDKGCKDSLVKELKLFANPEADFIANIDSQCINTQSFEFTNKSTIEEGSIKLFWWNLGNGVTSNNTNEKTHYSNSGFYKIILAATSDSSCTDTIEKTIRVFPKPIAGFTTNDSAQCLNKNSYIFTNTSSDSFAITGNNWNIAGVKTATTFNANHSFTTTGFKNITLTTTSSKGCKDTIERTVYVKPMPDPSFAPLRDYYCQSDSFYLLVPATPGGIFSGKNVTHPFFKPQNLWKDTVKYLVTVNGCTDSSTRTTNVYPPPTISLGNDTTLCKKEWLDLDVTFWNTNYQWQNGSRAPTFRVVSPGYYYVVATNICGTDTADINVEYRPDNCRLYLPNAFSPDGNRLNELFKPVLVNVEEMKMQIFTRWGELLFECDQDHPGWDGTYMGNPVPESVYVVIVTYKYKLGNGYIYEQEKGTVWLRR